MLQRVTPEQEQDLLVDEPEVDTSTTRPPTPSIKAIEEAFDYPFQDGYKSYVLQILFPWLVQGSYLNYRLRGRLIVSSCAVFAICQNRYQMLVFYWHVFWQMHKFQIDKSLSRCDHLNITRKWPIKNLWWKHHFKDDIMFTRDWYCLGCVWLNCKTTQCFWKAKPRIHCKPHT